MQRCGCGALVVVVYASHKLAGNYIVFELGARAVIETTKIEYLYDAVGAKVKKTVTIGTSVTVTHYIGGFQYAGEVLEFFPTSEGYVKYTMPRAIFDPGQYNYVYNYTDHLGNIRLSYTLDPQDNVLKILEENHYYPFGLKHKGYLSEQNIIISGDPNVMIVPYVEENPQRLRLTYNYKYNGKELQEELGLNVYDYGNRNYDPTIARFFNIDKFAEKYYDKTTYQYAANNPILYVDVKGDSIKVGNIEDQAKTLELINSRASGRFAINKDTNSIYLAEECTNQAGSDYYTDRLVEAIKDPDPINISFGQKAGTGQFGQEVDIDVAHGGGWTNAKSVPSEDRRSKSNKANVVITGNSNALAKDVDGNTLIQQAADILLHELVGHAIPWITKSDTGDAIKNENKARRELNVPEREEVGHPEY